MDLYQDGVEVLVMYEKNICTLDSEKSEIFDLPECPLGHNHCDAECSYCEAISPEAITSAKDSVPDSIIIG